MKVYVFGNEDVVFDNNALIVADKLKGKIKNMEFIVVKPNEDLPFADEKDVVILDTVEGIGTATVFGNKDLDELVFTKSLTVHDFDLSFQLKYLKKIGKLNKVTVVGLPAREKPDHLRIQSILRKLVAQDMQGS